MKGSAIIWVNGELVPAETLKVSPFDLGLSVGHGVFETVVAYDGVVFAVDRHMQRLVTALAKLQLYVPDLDELKEACLRVLTANDLTKGRVRVRVSVSGGVNALVGGDVPGNVIVTAVRQAKPTAFAKAIISRFKYNEASPLAGVKSSSYGVNLLAYRDAVLQGADEALMFNTSGALCEGTMSNVFVVCDGVVSTPSLDSGCLPGVTRGLILEVCESLEIPCSEGKLVKSDLLNACEIFLTSSVREVQLATMDLAASACCGAVTARIADAYHEIVRKETRG